MTIEEVGKLYNKRKAEIDEMDFVVKEICQRHKEHISPLSIYEITEEEFGIIIKYINQLKNLRERELQRNFLKRDDSNDD